MPRLIVTSKVVDVERWLESREHIAKMSKPFASDIRMFTAADGSNQVAFTAEVHDMEALQAFMASPPPDVAAADEKYGVIPPPTAYVER